MENMETEESNPTVVLTDSEKEQFFQEMDDVFGKMSTTILLDKMFTRIEDRYSNYYRSINYFHDTVEKCHSITPVFRRVIWDIDVFLGSSASVYRMHECSERATLPGKLVENLEALKKVGSDLFLDTNRIEMTMTLCVDFMHASLQNENNGAVSDIDDSIGYRRYPKKVKRKLDSVNNLIQANKYRLQLYSSIRNIIIKLLNPGQRRL